MGLPVQFRYQRELEPPDASEGFSRIDVVPFARRSDPSFVNLTIQTIRTTSMSRRWLRTVCLTLLSLVMPGAALAQREVRWDNIEVSAHLGAAGDLRVTETQTMVLTGEWNGGERRCKEAMFAQGIPVAAFEVSDIGGEFARLTAKGVAFTREPAPAGPVTLAVLADTCGNLIQLYQPA